jgi:hypothetical protein
LEREDHIQEIQEMKNSNIQKSENKKVEIDTKDTASRIDTAQNEKPVEDTFKDLEGLLPFFQIGEENMFDNDFYYDPIQEMQDQLVGDMIMENVVNMVEAGQEYMKKVVPEDIQKQLEALDEEMKDLSEDQMKEREQEFEGKMEAISKDIQTNAENLAREEALKHIPEALKSRYIELMNEGKALDEQYETEIQELFKEEDTKEMTVEEYFTYMERIEKQISESLKTESEEHEAKLKKFNEERAEILEEEFEAANEKFMAELKIEKENLMKDLETNQPEMFKFVTDLQKTFEEFNKSEESEVEKTDDETKEVVDKTLNDLYNTSVHNTMPEGHDEDLLKTQPKEGDLPASRTLNYGISRSM